MADANLDTVVGSYWSCMNPRSGRIVKGSDFDGNIQLLPPLSRAIGAQCPELAAKEKAFSSRFRLASWNMRMSWSARTDNGCGHLNLSLLILLATNLARKRHSSCMTTKRWECKIVDSGSVIGRQRMDVERNDVN